MGARGSALLALSCWLVVVTAGLHGAAAAPAASRAAPERSPPSPLAQCPGLERGVCTLPCQRATCGALAAFFRHTFNESKPWTRALSTWQVVVSLPCERIVPAAAAVGAPPAYCKWQGVRCCKPADVGAGACGAVHSVLGITLQADNVNGSLSDPGLMDAVEALHACGLRELDVESNDVGGRLLPRWGRLTNLTVLNVANNWLSGTLPPELGALRQLRVLEVGTNFLQGSLGEWVGGLSRLEVLNLGSNLGINAADGDGEELPGFRGAIPASLAALTRLTELDLQTNSFSGPIPADLCGPNSTLHVLNLRGNRLTGPATPVTRCPDLASLDLSANELTGSLPVTEAWKGLVSLLLGHNMFSGEIPDALYIVPILSYLDISANQLSGVLDDRVSLLVYMNVFSAAGNRLSGTITEDMFFLPQLTALNLAANQLTGVVQSSLGLAYGLREISFAGNTGLVGQLPDEAGGLPHLRRINIAGTGMSCVPNDAALAAARDAAAGRPAPPHVCPEGSRLPCFLEFLPYDAPRSDDSHMRCRPLRRKSPEDAARSCPPAITALLAEEAAAEGGRGGVYDAGGEAGEEWGLPPAYYQYSGCSCLHGYKASWSGGGTVMACTPDRALLEPWAWVLVALGGVLFLLVAALLLVASRWVLFRSRWMREVELRRKRARWGSLKAGGTISVVVTDVEGYSELMKTSPTLTRKAVAMHNAVMRKAVHDQAGHIFEQEGDSWAAAFHEAQDAVAFSLQVQQALHKVDWPLGIMATASSTQHEQGDGLADLEALGGVGAGGVDAGSASDKRGGRSLRQLLGVGSLGMLLPAGARPHEAAAAAALPPPPAEVQLGALGPLTSLSSKAPSREGSVTSEPSVTDSLSGTLGGVLGSPRSGDAGGASGRRASRQESGTALVGRSASEVPSASEYSVHEAMAASQASFSRLPSIGGGGGPSLTLGGSHSRRSRTSQSRFFSLLRPAGSASQRRVLYGLRVRMGVASGMLPGDTEIRSSAVFRLAKVVSDMANGGQVLLDAATFERIKDSQEELGAVDHHGYNDRQLAGVAGPASLASTCCAWLPWRRGARRAALEERVKGSSVVVLDMGAWRVPGLNMAAALSPAPSFGEGPRPASFKTLETSPSGRIALSAALLSAAFDPEALRLYSVLPPRLAERARIWGGALSTKPEWRQADRGFFDAPGAAAAVLTPEEAQGQGGGADLPPVTMVFAAVEGAKALSRARRDPELRALALLLRSTLRAALECVPGGYLCREQEGDLKYMLAFDSAAGALTWCLLAQEALMYAPWPPCLLALPELAEVHAPGDGALLFRGPRLKMGVCEGVPQSLEPDHVGRADYHGASVNAAARFMDAAAHGGQIACEEGLAAGVFSAWRLGDVVHNGVQRSSPALQGPGTVVPGGAAAARQAADAQPLGSRAPSASGGCGTAASLPAVDGAQPAMLWRRAAPASPGPEGGGGDLESASPLTRSPRDATQQRLSIDSQLGRTPGDAPPTISRAQAASEAAALLAGRAPQRAVVLAAAPVRAHHLGTYVFKGSDPIPMVALTTAALSPRMELMPRDEPKGKGRRVAERAGVADGAVAPLPDLLGGALREAFLELDAALLAGSGGGGGGGDGGYPGWLSLELARRRMLLGERPASLTRR
ncbi:MAG: hypothetical protein J3K34DRAFT_271511 [Monoraphidium minutum]|nr:MAG: hypothetical protein J3K34DRAFT_271511 [Monoraphidium minutum]